MSDQQPATCEQCAKRTEDYIDEPGWLRIETTVNGGVCGRLRFTLQRGRDRNGYGNCLMQIPEGQAVDFCRFECFKDWMWRVRRKVVGHVTPK